MKKAHPFTTLTLWVMVVLQAFLMPLGLPIVLFSLLVLATLLIWQASRYHFKFILWFMIPMALGFYLVHGDLLHNLWGRSSAIEAQQHAMLLWLRLLIIFTSAQICMQYVPIATLVQALFASRLPIGFSYLIASPLLLIQQLTEQIAMIKEAQLARGIPLHGSLWIRMKAITAMIFPLVNITLANLSVKTAALESKAFRHQAKRTTLWAPEDSQRQKYLRYFILCLLCLEVMGVILWR